MIRVNLLHPIGTHEGRVESLIRTGGASSFTSRREVLVGLACLVLAAGALFFQLGASGDAELAAVEDAPVVSTPRPPVIRDLDSGRAASTANAAEPVEDGGITSNPAEPLGSEDTGKPEPVAPSVQAASQRTAEEAPPGTPPATGSAPIASQPPTTNTPVLQQLVVSSQGESLRIFALTGTLPEYATFQLDKPKRVVVDMPGVRLALPRDQTEQAPDHPPVSRIRVGQYQTNPPRVRIVLDVTSYPDVEVLPQFNGLYLVVTEIPR